MKRSNTAAELSAAMERADLGWERNPYLIDGAVQDWVHRFPDVPIVDDGETDSGRGSTAFDKVRRVTHNGLVRFDWISEKTAGQERSGKIPTKFSLCTGNPETVSGIISGVQSGTSYPTIFVVKGYNGGFYWIAADLAPVFREYGVASIEEYPEGGYERGKAPPLYVKWSSIRRSGGARLKKMRAMGLPVDESVRVINGVQCGPGWFRYPELTISLSSLGVSKSSWNYVDSIDKIPALLDGGDGFGHGSEVTWDDLT